MKKSLIALAIAGLSFNAAAVNLDDAAKDQVANLFAKEQAFTANTAVGVAPSAAPVVAGTKLVDVKAGFALTTPYVRFDLSNGAKFSGVPALKGLTASEDGEGAWSLASGGDGQSFAIFNIAGGTTAAQALELRGQVTVANQADTNVEYNIYETAANAVNKTNSLVTGKQGTLISFVPVLKVTAAQSAGIKKIDITSTSESKKFEGGASATDLVDLKVALSQTGIMKQDGTAITAVTDVVSASSWKLDGNFKAATSLTEKGTPANTFTIAADKQSATRNNVTLVDSVVYNVNGTDTIPETTVKATYTVVTPVAGFTFAPVVVESAAVLKKNGSTAEVEMALNPNGAYNNFIRITNKTATKGAVAITVIDDAGNSKQTTLAAILGADKGELAARASTAQIDIKDIAAAAGVAADYTGKLRLVVDAQVPVLAGLNSTSGTATDGALTATTTRTDVVSGIAVQVYAAHKTNGVLTLLK